MLHEFEVGEIIETWPPKERLESNVSNALILEVMGPNSANVIERYRHCDGKWKDEFQANVRLDWIGPETEVISHGQKREN